MNAEKYQEQLNNLISEIKSDYLFSEKVAQKIVSKADVDHHAYSFDEVRDAAYELADFVQDIFCIYRESGY